MSRSYVIVVLLLLIGAGNCSPCLVMAQETGDELVESPDTEAAPPADSLDAEAYQFFPRSGHTEDQDSALSMEVVNDEMDSTADADAVLETQSDLDAWETSEQFSRSRFLETIPIQYPLDNSAYEGEDPSGIDSDDEEGGWRSSSIDRPQETMPIEDRPWIEWSKTTFLAQSIPSGGDSLGITSLDLRGTLKFSRLPFLFVTPRVGTHFLNSPSTSDIPDRLLDLSVDTTIYIPVNERWTIQASATPSFFSDLEEFKDSFRMVGRGLAFYRWSSELQLAGGFVYLGRKDIVALPAAGFVYTPTNDLKFDIMFPKPRMGYRYSHDGERERWVYMTGELGGGSWAVQRDSGDADLLTYRDLQLLLGIEHKQPGSLNWQFEGGYVFSRNIEYDSGVGDEELPSAAVLRVVLSF